MSKPLLDAQDLLESIKHEHAFMTSAIFDMAEHGIEESHATGYHRLMMHIADDLAELESTIKTVRAETTP